MKLLSIVMIIDGIGRFFSSKRKIFSLKYNKARQCNEIMLVSYIKSIHILMRRLIKPNHRVMSAYRFPNIDGFGSDVVVKTKTNLCGMPC